MIQISTVERWDIPTALAVGITVRCYGWQFSLPRASPVTPAIPIADDQLHLPQPAHYEFYQALTL